MCGTHNRCLGGFTDNLSPGGLPCRQPWISKVLKLYFEPAQNYKESHDVEEKWRQIFSFSEVSVRMAWLDWFMRLHLLYILFSPCPKCRKCILLNMQGSCRTDQLIRAPRVLDFQDQHHPKDQGTALWLFLVPPGEGWRECTPGWNRALHPGNSHPVAFISGCHKTGKRGRETGKLHYSNLNAF